RRLIRGEYYSHAHRLRNGKIKMGGRYRVNAAKNLRVLIRPTGKIDQPIHRGKDLTPGLLSRVSSRSDNLVLELFMAILQHLRLPIEDLSPQVSGLARPTGESRSRRDHRIPKIFSRGEANIFQVVPTSRLRGEIAATFAADEISADIQLVGLTNVQPCAHQTTSQVTQPSPCCEEESLPWSAS